MRGQYILDRTDEGLWAARYSIEGNLTYPSVVCETLHGLIAMCEREGLAMAGATDEAIDDIYTRITRDLPVFDWLKSNYPGHMIEDNQDERTGGHMGFRRPSNNSE